MVTQQLMCEKFKIFNLLQTETTAFLEKKVSLSMTNFDHVVSLKLLISLFHFVGASITRVRSFESHFSREWRGS